MKKGFILLEVLIASAISTFILAMVTSAVYQTNNSFARMNKISGIEMRALLVQHQMERDLSAAFVPHERKEKKGKPTEKSKKPTEKKESQKGKTSEQKKQYEDVPLKNGFLSKNKGKNLELLTFVTSSPIPMYGVAKPLIARVAYKLVPDKVRGKQPPSFTLFRQEDKQLDFGAFKAKGQKGIRSYELIKNIKSMSVEYTVTVKKQEQQKKQTGKSAAGKKSAFVSAKAPSDKQEDRGKPEYKKFPQWTEKEIKETKRQRPDFCVFTVELWDNLKKSSEDFKFSVYIFQGEPKPEKKKQEQESKKTDTQKGAGQGRRKAGQAGLRQAGGQSSRGTTSVRGSVRRAR